MKTRDWLLEDEDPKLFLIQRGKIRWKRAKLLKKARTGKDSDMLQRISSGNRRNLAKVAVVVVVVAVGVVVAVVVVLVVVVVAVVETAAVVVVVVVVVVAVVEVAAVVVIVLSSLLLKLPS
ncbi:hypothetical protein ElyMa_004833400 [Elysia marginata]|uniref:Uncharacterized protein n=1 Tax=Elysia marginata TaxID=1093978 RepID=A0AAV4ILE2_9GAST|nr:hypothetical protein ElyMa_004833400 [Elysia marginata]